jgi:hypothetical protein
MRSIELSWLARRDKWVPLPELVFTNDGNALYTGAYYRPQNWTLKINNKEICAKRGIIIINCEVYKFSVEATLAHEWRHHWQWFNGMIPETPIDTSSLCWSDLDNWKKSIKTYFKQPHEMDALRFECFLVKDDQSKYNLNVAIS